MADTRIENFTDGLTAVGTDRIPISRSPFGTGNNRYVTPAYIITLGTATYDLQYQPLDADLTAIAALDATAGFLSKTAANTYARRTLTGTAGVLSITNGDGTVGNPVFSIDALGISAGLIAANAVTTAKILDANVTYAKIQNVSATNRLLGRSTAAAGVIEEITVGGDITQSGSTFTIANDAITTIKILNANVTTAKVADANITYAKIQNISATQRILGRNTAGAGVTEEVTIAQLMAWAPNLQRRSVQLIIDGGGATITTGVKGYITVPFTGTITRAALLADQTGSIVVDIWKDTYTNFPPVNADSITASATPTISAALKSEDSTLTGWTTAVTAGDILGFNVDSVTTLQRVTVELDITATIS